MTSYRYRLERKFPVGVNTVLFVMLNPSTADDTCDDPTIRRCKQFAQSWHYKRLLVGNLFAFRATEPAALKVAKHITDVVGPENDAHLISMAAASDAIVCAWGVHHNAVSATRAAEVVQLLQLPGGAPLWRFAQSTKDGSPRHPLYRPVAETLVPYGR